MKMELVLHNLKAFNEPLLSFGRTALGIHRNLYFFFFCRLSYMTSFVVALCQSSSAHISRTRTKRHAYWIFFSILALVGALKKNVALQELYLSENNLNGYQDSMQLGDLLKYNSTLKTLDLSNNTMSDSGMPVLFEDVLCAFNSTVEKVFVVKMHNLFQLLCSHLSLFHRFGGDLWCFELSEDWFENADTE